MRRGERGEWSEGVKVILMEDFLEVSFFLITFANGRKQKQNNYGINKAIIRKEAA